MGFVTATDMRPGTDQPVIGSTPATRCRRQFGITSCRGAPWPGG
jgi:hypothetical protein